MSEAFVNSSISMLSDPAVLSRRLRLTSRSGAIFPEIPGSADNGRKRVFRASRGPATASVLAVRCADWRAQGRYARCLPSSLPRRAFVAPHRSSGKQRGGPALAGRLRRPNGWLAIVRGAAQCQAWIGNGGPFQGPAPGLVRPLPPGGGHVQGTGNAPPGPGDLGASGPGLDRLRAVARGRVPAGAGRPAACPWLPARIAYPVADPASPPSPAARLSSQLTGRPGSGS